MKRYKVTYKQRFMGEVLKDSYYRTVNGDWELNVIENALFDDPHVFSVVFKDVTEGESENGKD